jgi:hypothetical protein
MSSIVTFNGSNYVVPANGDTDWGTNVSSYLIAIAAGSLQKTGGSFTLSAETDFGASFGLKSLYYKSRSSNPASTGILRLANNSDSVSFRNAANSADLALIVNASNQLTFNGNPIAGAGLFTPNRAIISDGSGNLTFSSTTATELGYSSGVTSAIQTQLNSKLNLAGGTLTGDLTFSSLKGLFLTDNTTNTIKLLAPSGVTTYTLKLPTTSGLINQVLTTDGSGNTSWTNASGTGTVNSGTQYQFGYYATSSNIISSNSSITTNVSNQFLVPVGSVVLPSYTFTGFPTTGFYHLGSGGIGAAIGGFTVAKITSSGISVPDGTVSLPSYGFSSETDTGIYLSGIRTVTVTTAGNNRFSVSDSTISSLLRHRFVDGTVSLPSLAFTLDSDSGLYSIADNSVGVSANGANVATFASTGVAIKGTTTNDSAASGFVGETVSSYATTTSFPSTNVWGDLTSIVLTAGDWLISVNFFGADLTSTGLKLFAAGISNSGGSTFTDYTVGDNAGVMSASAGFGTYDTAISIPAYRVSLTGNTTYNLKFKAIYTSGTLDGAGRISAVRIR